MRASANMVGLKPGAIGNSPGHRQHAARRPRSPLERHAGFQPRDTLEAKLTSCGLARSNSSGASNDIRPIAEFERRRQYADHLIRIAVRR